LAIDIDFIEISLYLYRLGDTGTSARLNGQAELRHLELHLRRDVSADQPLTESSS
jgi:hypothetical protein